MNKSSKEIALARFDEEVKKHYRWNFTANFMDWTLFSMGMGFVSVNTILPAFIRHFTSSNFLIGFIPCLGALGWFLPQILVANFVQKLRRKKNLVIFSGLGERIPWFFLFLAVVLFSPSSSFLFLISFFILYGMFSFSGGIGGSAWVDMLAKVIPLKKRGHFFGWSNFLGGGAGIVAAFLSIYLLRNFAFPRNFALCFLFAFAATSVSYGAFVLIREPVSPTKGEESSFKEYLFSLPSLLRKDRNFFSFLVSSILFGFGGMATAFFAVYAMNKLALPDSQIGVFTLLLLLGQSISSILWGYLGNKKGYKLVMELGTIATILAILLAIFSSSIYLFYGVFFIIGMAFSAYFISFLGIVMEFSTPETRPTYIALANTIKAPFVSLSPLLGGFLADKFSFPFVFVLTIFILLGGILYSVFLVQEPRHLPAYKFDRYLARKPT